MKQRVRHLLSVLLVCAMVLSLLPISVLAEEVETPLTTVTEPANVPEVEGEPEEEPAPEPELTPEPADEPAPTPKIVYVGGTGENHYDSLAAAVTAINDMPETNFVIKVQSNLTTTKCARIVDKNVAITSDEGGLYTITRGDGFETIDDNSRSWYNPAMIEVTTPNGKGASVTLENITLDDAGMYEGEIFAQASNDGKSESKVQDAIVAAYGTDKATAEIILGDGAVLKNFGGMSAVRVTGGATLTMDVGSVICDDKVTNRSKGDNEESNGPAGAVWVQGTNATMMSGAEIRNVIGRAFYVDGGSATINGTISDITPDADMWQGKNGLAVHVRNSADVTFGSTALADNTNINIGYLSSAVYVNQGSFEMVYGSTICNFACTAVQGYGSYEHPAGSINIKIDGEICGLKIAEDGNKQAGNAINMNESSGLYCEISPNANIHDNVVMSGSVYIQGLNQVLDIKGKIHHNTSQQHTAGIWEANNQQGGTKITMYPGAEVSDNFSNTGEAAAVIVSYGTFTMEGGKISNNTTRSGLAGGVSVRRNGTFIMNGGEITGNKTTGNGGGIRYNDSCWGNECIILNGGTISGNISNANAVLNEKTGEYEFSGGVSNDISVATSEFSFIDRYVTIGDDMVIGNENIYFEKYGFTLDNPGSGVKFGNASTDCETTVTAKLGSQNLTNVIASLWYQSDKPSYLTTINGLKGITEYNSKKDLYAAVIETKADGTPAENAKVTLQVVEWDENDACHLVLPSNTNGYAVVFVQEADQAQAQVVKITPADMTVYMGGDDGYEGVVGDGSGTGTPSNSMPTPLFSVDVSGITDVSVENIVLSGDGSRKWQFKSAGNGLYYMESTGDGSEGNPQAPVRVTFTDIDGKFHLNDEFNPTELEELYATYAINIYRGNAGEVTASVNGTNCLVATGTGMLTVRAVADKDPTSKIESSVPAEPVNKNSAVAVASAGTHYTINNTGVAVDENAAPSLLFDHIIEDVGSTERTDALKAKVDQALGAVGGSATRHYEIMYLDLVDANNGNAWIKADQPVDIYWGYPEGTGMNTTFQIVHFKDLHRDGTNSGYDVSDIQNCTVDTSIQVRTTAEGIKFSVGSGGFSPFALVWTEGGSSSGGGTGTRDDYTLHYVTNGGKHLSSETKSSAWTKDYEDLPIPVRDGYTFEGWYWDLRLTEPVTGDVKVNKTTVTLYAKWSGGNYGPDDTGVSKWLETDEHNAFLSGYPDGSFLADKNMTRAEVAQMFYSLLLDKNVKITKSFSDVPTDAWYAKAVNTLSSLGMLGGYPDGTFRPDAPITRAEFAAIALAFAYDPASASCSYTDVSTSAWYYTYVAQATTYGWIGGYPDGSFRPNNSITRAEVAVIVNNMLGRDADESYINRNADELVSFVDLSKNHWAYYTIMEATNTHDYTTSSNGESWKA